MTDLVALIRDVRFSSVKLQEAYDIGEVDYLLDRLLAAVERSEPIAPILDDVQLSEVRLREGYDIAEVDAFLANLRDQAGGGRTVDDVSTGSTSGVVDDVSTGSTSGVADDVSTGSTSGVADDVSTSAVPEEVALRPSRRATSGRPGFFARLFGRRR